MSGKVLIGSDHPKAKTNNCVILGPAGKCYQWLGANSPETEPWAHVPEGGLPSSRA